MLKDFLYYFTFMPKARLSSKYQITIPKAIRERLKLKKGSRVTLVAGEKAALLLPYPEKWTAYGWGLGKDVWKNIDPLEYIRQERASWGP